MTFIRRSVFQAVAILMAGAVPSTALRAAEEGGVGRVRG